MSSYFFGRPGALLALSLSLPVVAVTLPPDPTRPASYSASAQAQPVQYRLSSVVIGNGRKIAVINGAMYGEGEATPLGKLVAIESDQVMISGSRRHILKLGLESVKSPH